MVFVPYHYLIQYQNINHIYKDDIHQEYDKQDEISLLINVRVLHVIHISPMLVQNVEYTKEKQVFVR